LFRPSPKARAYTPIKPKDHLLLVNRPLHSPITRPASSLLNNLPNITSLPSSLHNVFNITSPVALFTTSLHQKPFTRTVARLHHARNLSTRIMASIILMILACQKMLPVGIITMLLAIPRLRLPLFASPARDLPHRPVDLVLQ
jgi:hypothetical protein